MSIYHCRIPLPLRPPQSTIIFLLLLLYDGNDSQFLTMFTVPHKIMMIFSNVFALFFLSLIRFGVYWLLVFWLFLVLRHLQ